MIAVPECDRAAYNASSFGMSGHLADFARPLHAPIGRWRTWLVSTTSPEGIEVARFEYHQKNSPADSQEANQLMPSSGSPIKQGQ